MTAARENQTIIFRRSGHRPAGFPGSAGFQNKKIVAPANQGND
jgi:hypothetical protein